MAHQDQVAITPHQEQPTIADVAVDYEKNTWKAGRVSHITATYPETIELRSTHKADPHHFVVNKALLCYYSPYHDKLLNGPFQEDQDSITVVNVDASQSILRLFYSWLTTGHILLDFEVELIIDFYIFADSLNSLALKRSIMTQLQKVAKSEGDVEIIGYQSLQKIWHTSLESSQLYNYILDTFAFHWTHEMDDSVVNPVATFGIPGYFLHSVMVKNSVNRFTIHRGVAIGECPCCSNVCKYHEHTSKEEREATCGSNVPWVDHDYTEEDRDDEEQDSGDHMEEADKEGGEKEEGAITTTGEKRSAQDEEGMNKRPKLEDGA